ncbi:MAG TPA: 4Fe-4S dicluster domain-containing protein [bacterium]|nr:4Fe-4S dicluster domain-containing protein [bacterium]
MNPSISSADREKSAKTLRELIGRFFKKLSRPEHGNSEIVNLERSKKRIHALVDRFFGKRLSRRTFLKAAGTVAGAAVIASPKPAEAFSFAEFFQKHYKELTPEDKERVFRRLEKETKEKHGVDVTIADPQPIPGVEFAYFLNLSKCNGNRKCVEACVKENNQSRDPAIQYITVLEMEAGSFDLNKSDRYYNPDLVPQKDKYYLPVQCHQCRNPPCVKACPVEATWKEADGIVVIDYNWCIGCRYCQAACPYEARHFNFTEPSIPADEINPNQSYLSNRIRPKGVMEKCTFCLHRTRVGKYPACLEACPTGARKFGNLKDPNSEVRNILSSKRVFVLKEEVGTDPQFYYFFD